MRLTLLVAAAVLVALFDLGSAMAQQLGSYADPYWGRQGGIYLPQMV